MKDIKVLLTESVNGVVLNEKFNSIPEDRRREMINGAMKAFAIQGYGKASMSDIAKEAGVSKALLFHYFDTKKELFLYLWNLTAEKTQESLLLSGVVGDKDFFSVMEKGLRAKMDLARKWPWMALFSVKAWYEDDEEVSSEITRSIDKFPTKDGKTLRLLYPETNFRDDLDLGLMYQDMYYMSEGYLWHQMERGNIDPDKMEKEYMAFLELWKKAYLKGEKDEVCN